MVDLPAPESPVNQSTAGLWPFACAAHRLGDVERLPVDVGGAPQREVDHPGADGEVGQPVDDDEAAGAGGSLRIGVEGDRLAEGEVDLRDLVQRQRLGGQVLEGVDVDLVLDLGDRAAPTVRVPILMR